MDLLVDYGDHFDAYEIKFSSTPNADMTQSLLAFKNEYPIKKCAVLNLRREKYPFSNGIIAQHWSFV